MIRYVLSLCSLVAALALALAVPVLAQESAPAPPAPGAAENGFQDDVAADIERTGEKLVALAEAIPGEKYGWRPTEGVRSVSEVFVHVLNANTLLPPSLGAAPPADVAMPESMEAAMAWMRERESTMTAKDDVLAALRKSIDYAAGAVRGLESSALGDEIQALGFPASRRAYVLIVLTHNHEHLGQAIAYARSLGVTPPWSAAGEGYAEDEDSDAD